VFFLKCFYCVSCELGYITEVVQIEPVVVPGYYACKGWFSVCICPQRFFVSCLVPQVFFIFAFEKCEDFTFISFRELFSDLP